MGELKKLIELQRRIWRITPDAPHGEIVDPDAAPAKPRAAASDDEPVVASWTASSYDLLNGLEVTETAPGELFEDHFSPPPSSKRGPPDDSPGITKHQWILRFALKLTELDLKAESKHAIGLARELWPSQRQVVPEEMAHSVYEDGQAEELRKRQGTASRQ